ncbi:MAG: murein biosynthesis integral membrane protein MurJ [Phycisphaerae bacterium]|nr:murein biosynthesis integral membrane protein MurJ [Phycisphaerae bacterium]
MIRGFRQIALLTALSRVFGFLRDMAYSHYFGAEWVMNAWIVGFKVPNLSRRLFGEGAASASLIPVYTEDLHQNPQQARRLVNTIASVIFVVLTAATLVGEIIILFFYAFIAEKVGTRLGLAIMAIMLPYMVMVCLAAILGGILNVHKHFATPAAAPVLLNLFLIGGLVITGSVFRIPPESQIYILAICVLIAGAAQLAIQIPPLRSRGIRLIPAWDVQSESFKKVLWLMGPMVLGLTATQINTLMDDVIALSFARADGYPLCKGAVSHLYFAQRLYQFPLGIFGISIATAIFPVLSADAARKDYPGLCATLSRGLQASLFIAIPATAGLILVARPIVMVAFEHGKFQASDTDAVAWTLCFYALGLTGFFAQQIVIRVFYSLQNSKLPAITAFIAVVVNLCLNLILIWPFSTGGLALSTAISSYLQVVILMTVLARRYGKMVFVGFSSSIFKTMLGTILMIAVGWFALVGTETLCPSGSWKKELIRLSLAISAAGGIYLVTGWLTKNPMLSLIVERRSRTRLVETIVPK